MKKEGIVGKKHRDNRASSLTSYIHSIRTMVAAAYSFWYAASGYFFSSFQETMIRAAGNAITLNKAFYCNKLIQNSHCKS